MKFRLIYRHTQELEYLQQKLGNEQRKNSELEHLLQEYMGGSKIDQIIREKDSKIIQLTQELADLKVTIFAITI